MPHSVVAIKIKSVVPTNGGCAVFLGNDDKTFVVYIDQMVGMALMMAMHGVNKERPLTHDLIASILTAVGANIQRVVINDFSDNIYYARLILSAENELHQRKIMEIDARPSDCLVLVARLQAPLYISASVWDQLEDETPLLRSLQERASQGRMDKDDQEDDPPGSEDTLFGG